MSEVRLDQLLEAGVHFGHQTRRWNPKMKPFIFTERNGIHIIDLRKTLDRLRAAQQAVREVVLRGDRVLFVCTKKQLRTVVEQEAQRSGSFWVTERWLGGMLTNFRTIRSRLKRLEELEAIDATDSFGSYSKKMESQLRREMTKIRRNLQGVRRMEKLPGALVVIDVGRETTALSEARKLGIPTICLIDTDGDPDVADIPIPGNDDSMRSIDVIVRELCLAVSEGKQGRYMETGKENEDAGAEGQGDRRRSRRSQFRSDQPAVAEPDAVSATE